MARLYRSHGFAQLAGVTVKALRHYDRLGLLRPVRNASGYRMYSEADLDRLRRIRILKFLGVPLKQIQGVLDRSGFALLQSLRTQRAALENSRSTLDRAIQAIQLAEKAFASGRVAERAAWGEIAQVIATENTMEAMKKYYSEEAWLKRRSYYERWPSPDLENLFRDIALASGEDPAGVKAQTLTARWRQLSNDAVTGDPDVQAGVLAAWNDRDQWPLPLKEKIASLQIENGIDFLAHAIAAFWKQHIASEEWRNLPEQRRRPTEPWNQWVLRAQSALEEDPPGENARALVLRVMEL